MRSSLACATDEIKPMLLRLLGRAATPEALAAVRAAMTDRNADVSNTAVRTLAGWPDASVAEDILTLARTTTNATHKVLFLRDGVAELFGPPDEVLPKLTGKPVEPAPTPLRPVAAQTTS